MHSSKGAIVAAVLSAFCFLSTQAQFPYEASVFTESYVELQNPTLLDIELGWDDPELIFPLPFIFPIGDVSAFELSLGNYGEMIYAMDEIGSINILWPLSVDVIDVSNDPNAASGDVSTIGHQTEGNAPNRIFKIEWNNCGLYEEIDGNGTSNIRLNWQVWLREGSGIIEYRFGPTTFAVEDIFLLEGEPFTSGMIFNWDYDGYTGNIYAASGDAAAPSWSLETDFESWYYGGPFLDNVPQEGQGYRFNGGSTSISDPVSLEASFQLYPNPTSGTFWVSNLSSHFQNYTCVSASGQVVEQWTLAPRAILMLDEANLAAGIYVVHDEQGMRQKLMIR